MVLGVCRRLLHNPHDAEDAFQVTFLVLVRKASSLHSPGTIGNWLYGVAHRTALEVRKAAAKRRAKEAMAIPRAETSQDNRADLQLVFDQELRRLPDKHREVVVLCDLEGKTRKQVALDLGCAEGTVASRLARARTVLAKRLTRHGLPLSAGALAVLLTENAASAVVPASVISSTIKAACAYAAGPAAAAAAISTNVAALTQGVLKTVWLTKLKIATAALVAITIVGVGAGSLIYQTQGAEDSKETGNAAGRDQPGLPREEAIKEVPKLFREKSFTCVTLAEAVNHYVALGEEASVKELESLVSDDTGDIFSDMNLARRMSWVCRILFQPKEDEPLRGPGYGAVSLPWNSMPLKKWPLFPLAASGSSYFVLSELYTLGGIAEKPKAYLKYCRANGQFRKEAIPIPSKAQALKDLEQLRQSKAWKAIKWKDSGKGWSYYYSEDWIWEYIKKQAEEIPEGEENKVNLKASAPAGEEITVEATPPVVVKTVPQAGMTNVDAKTTAIQVTFSKEMMDKSWSWSQLSDDTFPKINGKPKYLKDKRTCVVTVKLEPDKTYAIWLNSEKFGNFKDADGRPAVPYLLVFKTAK
jgi:RNA polymerase sigma factor (sigma-70 family)